MNLQGIVSVSGKPGLWKALAQNKTGYVLESLDAQKTKLVVNLSTAKLAALNEITIFGLEGDIKLLDVFERMKTASVPAVKDDGKKLREFFYEVAADHDEEKVYSSDIKKIISWYNILKDMPLFNEEPATATPVAEEAAVAEPVKEEAPVAEAPKAKAKKAPAKKA
ncbi:DUF5606 domain-containing protein [Mucilaginibacter lutimaris]|uniref:DUF5606 domain-containing protein n=1 Tax=Mucilaginibacter lutimaris TaxID=931629 RepID=A0ABW2ZHR2_9SPHI